MKDLDDLLEGMEAELVSESTSRIEDDFYNAAFVLPQNYSHIVIFGEKNIAFALQLAINYPTVTIHLVCISDNLVDHLNILLPKTELTNIVFGTCDLEKEADVAWLCVDAECDYGATQARSVIETQCVSYMSGSISTNGLDKNEFVHFIYRNTTRYFLRVASLKTIAGIGLAGSGNQPDISVVIPCYNTEKYLRQCLDSLTAPTFLVMEILVIDDSSTDSSGLIGKSYAAKYDSVNYVLKENGGCASAREKGLELAQGRFVGFVDSDDWIYPGMYESLFCSAVINHSEITFSRFIKFYQEDNVKHVAKENLWCDEGNFNGVVNDYDQLYGLQPAIWRCLYSRDFLSNNRLGFPQEIKRFDDLIFHFMSSSVAKRISCISGAHYHYRLGRVGQDVAIDDERLFVHFDIFDILSDFVSKKGDSYLEKMLLGVELSTHAWAISKIRPEFSSRYKQLAKYNFRRHYSLGFVALCCMKFTRRRNYGRAMKAFKLYFGI